MYNVPKWLVFAARFLKCVWPFWDSMHWRFKPKNITATNTTLFLYKKDKILYLLYTKHSNTWHITQIIDYFNCLNILLGYLKVLKQAKKWQNGYWYDPCSFHVSFNQEVLKIWSRSFKLVKSPKTKSLKTTLIQK